MKNRLLLLPVLLTLAACRHIPARAPTQEEIQRQAPPGGLVRVTLRDAKQPSRVTTYLVDVNKDEIVSKVDGSPRGEMEGQDATSMKTAAAQAPAFLLSNVEVFTDCKEPDTDPGCIPDPNSWNGDPHGGSGGGGDPTGHDPGLMVRRLAALTFWSIQQVRIASPRPMVNAPAPTRGAR